MDTSKIIKGVVNNGRYTVTAPIVKEDYGLYLQIEGVELPSTYQVDFSNDEYHGTSVTMIGNSDGVLIPRQFIDTGKDIFAFLYHVGDNYGKTVYKFRIPNKVRPDRTNEQPTPEEQSTIDQLIGAMNTAVAQTAQDVVDAEASAQAAGYDADRAEEARSASLDYAEQAEASAISAEQSATASANSASASANSASQSAQIKSDVEALADDAQASASASAQSASQASASEQGCARAVLDAASAAAIARARAEEANGYAQTASAKAQDASQSASTASQKATESAQSANNAQTHANTAEQAKVDSQTAQGLAESARDSAISAKNDAEQAKADAESARDEAVQAVASISGALDDKADVITDTASGAIASFSDGADNLTLKSLVVNIDPVQDTSSGDPSPENICPISGWTGMQFQKTGVNIWNGTLGNDVFVPFPTKVGVQYSVSAKMVDSTQNTYLYVRKRTVGDTSTGTIFKYIITGKTVTPQAFTAEAEYEYGLWSNAKYTNVTDVQIEVGSSATDYAPYQGQTIPISWQTEAGTVYGGKLDVLTGILTVYPYYASYNGEALTGEWISDRDVYAVGTTPTIGAQVVNIGAQGTEYQLEPHEIASLLGQNNIFADTGDVSAEYRADTKLYIERLTAPDTVDMIADSNIISGQYFMVGNTLYKATSNIANGAQIIVGTNCIRKSLSEALNEINA